MRHRGFNNSSRIDFINYLWGQSLNEIFIHSNKKNIVLHNTYINVYNKKQDEHWHGSKLAEQCSSVNTCILVLQHAPVSMIRLLSRL